MTVVRWARVGVHPTPAPLARLFATLTASAAAQVLPNCASLKVLDACAGDGRLGHALARRLVRAGYSVDLTLVEVEASQAHHIRRARTYGVSVVNENILTHHDSPYDLVVSNPPYLVLTSKVAASLGLDWEQVSRSGRNLYGLIIEKCLALTSSRGLAAFIAPHGWLFNHYSAGLRASVANHVSSIKVFASSSRTLFPNVNQDVAIQLMKRRVEADPSSTQLKIGYDLASLELIAFNASPSVSAMQPIVRVGCLVWNREKEKLAKRGSLPVIYGGNITPGVGSLEFSHGRYADRQFARRRLTPASYVVRSPCLLLKRTMRGVPGQWELDVAVVTARDFECVPENHVIGVPLRPGTARASAEQFAAHLSATVGDMHRHFGHANLSANLVRHAISLLDGPYLTEIAHQKSRQSRGL